MDRRVKERLIGASILVALIVLVVPELLSGPKPARPSAAMLPAATPEPIRNVTVDLSTSKPPTNSEPEAEAAPQPASSAPAPPAASGPPAGATAPDPAPINSSQSTPAARPAARPASVETAVSSPISARYGSWSVQLGSFSARGNADNLTRQLKGQGFSVFVLTGGSGTAVRYRVRVGPLADREAAVRMAAKLKGLGHDSSLVAPAG